MKTLQPLLLLTLAVCASPWSTEGTPQVLRSDSYVAATLPAEAGAGFFTDGAAFTPSRAAVESIEARLRELLLAVHADPSAFTGAELDADGVQWTRERIDEILGHLPDYLRQYIGVIRPDGARQIFVNVIAAWEPDDPMEIGDDWIRTLVFVDDGGSHYWRFLFDPASGTLSSIWINGEG